MSYQWWITSPWAFPVMLLAVVIGFPVMVGCVMTLASIVVGDPDPLAWAKPTSSGHARAQREYERQRDEYQRSLRTRGWDETSS